MINRIALMGASIDAVDFGMRSFENTRSIQIAVWDRWVHLDDAIAGKVYKGIEMCPIVRKGEKKIALKWAIAGLFLFLNKHQYNFYDKSI